MLILGIQEEEINTNLSQTVENQGMGTNKVLKKEQLQATSKTVRNMNRDNMDQKQPTCLARAEDVIQRNLLATHNMALVQDSLLARVKKVLANISTMVMKTKIYNQENHQVVKEGSHQRPGHRTQGQASHLDRREITLGQESLLV